MQKFKSLMPWSFAGLVALSASLLLSGCASESQAPAASAPPVVTPTATPSTMTPPPAPANVPPAAAASAAAAPDGGAPAPAAAAAVANTNAPVLPPVRIKAGASTSVTDADGNVWLPDQGFEEGETAERPDAAIVGSKSPQLYRSEHWGMSSFSYPVPNGKYIVKLHFCETYDGITAAGDRVFSFNVQGQDFKDFDVWAKSGGYLHPYVETVNVEVTDGKLKITFTPNVQNPEINGIEILPAT